MNVLDSWKNCEIPNLFTIIFLFQLPFRLQVIICSVSFPSLVSLSVMFSLQLICFTTTDMFARKRQPIIVHRRVSLAKGVSNTGLTSSIPSPLSPFFTSSYPSFSFALPLPLPLPLPLLFHLPPSLPPLLSSFLSSLLPSLLPPLPPSLPPTAQARKSGIISSIFALFFFATLVGFLHLAIRLFFRVSIHCM